MGCFGPTAPGKLDYGQILRDTLTTQVGLQPLLMAANQQYQPAQTGQTLRNIDQMLFGAPASSYDLQTYTPPVMQTGRQLSYGRVPKDFLGQVNRPTLPYYGQRADGSKGWIYPSGGNGLPASSPTAGNPIGLTGSGQSISQNGQPQAWQDAPGGPGSAATVNANGTGSGVTPVPNPHGGSGGFGIGGPWDFFGNSNGPQRIASQQYGEQTITSPAHRGLVDIMAQMQNAGRQANINDLASLGPDTVAALMAANPQAGGLINSLNQQAQTQLDAGVGLTPEETRLAQQASRAASGARGLNDSNLGIADETMRQLALGRQFQQQNQQFASGVVGLDQGYLQNPMLSILMGNSGVGAQGQGMMTGNLFNPESPFAGNIAGANQQMAALFADPSTLQKINMTNQTVSNILGTVGSVAGMFGGMGGMGGGAGGSRM